jgi:hypothetical protein
MQTISRRSDPACQKFKDASEYRAPSSRSFNLLQGWSLEHFGDYGLFGFLPSTHVLGHLLNLFVTEVVRTVPVDTT